MEGKMETRRNLVIDYDNTFKALKEDYDKAYSNLQTIDVKERENYDLTESEVIKEREFPEIYEMLNEVKRLNDKCNEYEKEIKNQMNKYMEEYEKELEELNKDINDLDKEVEKLKTEIAIQEKEIEALRSSKDVNKWEIQKLEESLSANQNLVTKWETELDGFKERAEKVAEEHKKFTEEYKEYIDDFSDFETSIEDEAKKEEVEKKSSEEKGRKLSNKGKNAPSGRNASKEEAEESIEDKFERLTSKKRLNDKEQIELLDIMNDPENYEKFKLADSKSRIFGIFPTKSKADKILGNMSKKMSKELLLKREELEETFRNIPIEIRSYPTVDIKDWKAFQAELIKNPELSVNVEQYYKKIMIEYADKQEDMTKEQKRLYESIPNELAKIAKLKGALKTHAAVTSLQKQLPSAPDDKDSSKLTPSKKTAIEDLKGKTVPPDDVTYPPVGDKPKEKEKEKE